MENEEVKVAQADRLDSSAILVTFKNGRVAKYSAALLYSFLSQADEVKEDQD